MAEHQLGLPIDLPQTKPPDEREPIVRSAAARSLAPAIAAWINDMSYKQGTPIYEELVAEIAQVADATDGYAAARKLENNKGWCPDSELVELLDGLPYAVSRACDRLTALWVSTFGVTVPFVLDDTVTLVRSGWGDDEVTGTVVGIDPKYANVTVCCPSLGHVKEGQGTHGIIVAVEKCRAIAPDPGSP
jgi:hypothetical protein